MSRFYRELHDRELLLQAASILQEVHERRLLDIFLPQDARADGEDNQVFPRRLAAITVKNERLHLMVEKPFFQPPRSR